MEWEQLLNSRRRKDKKASPTDQGITARDVVRLLCAWLLNSRSLTATLG